MFFEARMKDRLYSLDVVETQTTWHIGIKEEDKDWTFYDINKNDFQEAERTISFLHKGNSYLIDVLAKDDIYSVYTRGSYRDIKITNDEMMLQESLKVGESHSNESEIKTAIPGKVVQVLVEVGQEVNTGQALLIMEAMKMENEILAPKKGKIRDVLVKDAQNVDAGSVLIRFE